MGTARSNRQRWLPTSRSRARPAGAHGRLDRRGRSALALLSVALVVTPAAAGAAPVQGEVPEGDDGAGDQAVEIDIDIDVTLSNAGEVTATIEDIEDQVSTQLTQYEEAQQAVTDAVADLTDVNATINELTFQIEELTFQSDQVVARAFVNPPSAGAVDLIATESATDLATKQALLGLQADADADVLASLADARAELDEELAVQEEARVDAEDAEADATDALTSLEATMDQRSRFVVMVQSLLEEGDEEGVDPEFADEYEALSGQLQEIEDATAAERALAAIEEQAQQAAASGAFVCPVQGDVDFSNDWGAPRSGGRTHEGNDMFAATGTPTVAPVSGRVEHRSNSLGGLSWYVYGDDGHMYYGTHLSSYHNVGAGWVEGGTVIGYVGQSGNAATTAPHLHFQYHPGGGSPINPYDMLRTACGPA